MDFTSKEYLPNSEERIEYLRKIINGRPVAIFAAGPSIKELENRIDELRHTDICYVGLNIFSIYEKYILRKIDKHFHIGICMADISRMIEYITNDFFNRDEDNMLISQQSSSFKSFTYISTAFDLNKFINKYDKRLLFVCGADTTDPNKDRPLHFASTNTLSALIQLMIIGKAPKIILFGADGGYANTTELYYRQYEYGGATVSSIVNDAILFNLWIPILLKNTYDTYNIRPIEILNCSENSSYTPFPRISYNNVIELLNDKKNDKAPS